MLRMKNLAVPLALLVGALGGYLVATGQVNSMFRAKAASPPAEGKDADCCSGEGRQQFIAAEDEKDDKNGKKPNIVFIMGDDVGWFNIGAYHRGIMSGKTPNLDKLASQGMLFTDYYAEASC